MYWPNARRFERAAYIKAKRNMQASRPDHVIVSLTALPYVASSAICAIRRDSNNHPFRR